MPPPKPEMTVALPTGMRPSTTRVARFGTLDELAPLAATWDRLARGVPFRSWAWASNWWRHCGHDPRGSHATAGLYVLVVFHTDGSPIGIAPWYVESSASGRRVVQFLGGGEVCSDYLSVLCERSMEARVSDALARWLTEANGAQAERPLNQGSDRWDLLELTGLDLQDNTTRQLAERLKALGNTVHRRPGPNCWRIELPRSWEAFLARLSKHHRKQIRRAQRSLFATGRVVVHTVERLEDLSEGQEILIDLHQRRWRSLRRPGRFASGSFLSFHCDVMPELLRNGQLRLDWLELDGWPVTAEYQLLGRGVVYAYQAGVSPDALAYSPGQLSTIVMVRRAIEQGYRAFDFLRGDEPFKAHWRAQPRQSLEIRVVPARRAAQWRHGIWLAGARVKEWIKSGLRLVADAEPL